MMIVDYMASEISTIEWGMVGDRAVVTWVSRASVCAEVGGKVDFANGENQQVIDFYTVLKDSHHEVPRYQRSAVEETYSLNHELGEGNGVVVRGWGSVSENIC